MFAILNANDEIVAWVDEESARRLIVRKLAKFERITTSRALRAITDSLQRCVECGALWKQKHDPSPFDRLAAIERKEILDGIRGSLDRRQRVLLRMRYDGDLTFRQIALALAVTEEAAIQMHGRLLSKLKSRFDCMKIRSTRDI